MSSLPLISVCIPVFNGESFIRFTIDSVLNQIYPNIEILIQDNASNDGTWEILQEYANLYDNVLIERNQTNLGMVSNWNKVINRAKGEFLTLLSADDLLSRDFLEKSYKIIIEKNVEIAVSNHFYIKSDQLIPRKKLVKAGCYTNHTDVVLLRNPFSINFTLFRRNVVEEMKVSGQLFRSYYTCDYDLCLRLSFSHFSLYYTDECLGGYRLHSSNLSQQKYKMLKQAALVVFSHKKILKTNSPVAYRLTIIRFIIVFILIMINNAKVQMKLFNLLLLRLFPIHIKK